MLQLKSAICYECASIVSCYLEVFDLVSNVAMIYFLEYLYFLESIAFWVHKDLFLNDIFVLKPELISLSSFY